MKITSIDIFSRVVLGKLEVYKISPKKTPCIVTFSCQLNHIRCIYSDSSYAVAAPPVLIFSLIVAVLLQHHLLGRDPYLQIYYYVLLLTLRLTMRPKLMICMAKLALLHYYV